MRVQNLPRHLGQHSGGMVVAMGKLSEVVPLEPAAMEGRVVIQWDKDDCADLGIVKVDLLGLGMLGAIEKMIPMIAGARGREGGPRAPPARRPGGLRDAPEGGHDRPLPGGEPRADGVAPPPHADDLLRHRRAGRDHPARADRGRHGPPVLRPAAGQGARRVSAPVPRADPQAHARRAALPGAAPEDRDGRRGLHGRRGRGAAPRDGLQALGGAHGSDRGRA